MGETPLTRAFVAAILSPTALDELEALSEKLRIRHRGISWSKRHNMHITLRFLGDLCTEELDRFSAHAFKTLSLCTPLTLRAHRLGAFPNYEKPRVLWTGLDGDLERLAKLNRTAEESANQAGLKPEQRPFKPHITLARFRDPRLPPALRQKIHRHTDFRGSEFHLDSVTLFSSVLGSSGPIYEKLQEYPLQC